MEAKEEGLSLSLGWSHFRGCRSFTMLFHLCPRLHFKGNGALNSECLSTSNRSSHSAKVRAGVKSPRPGALIYSGMEIGPLFLERRQMRIVTPFAVLFPVPTFFLSLAPFRFPASFSLRANLLASSPTSGDSQSTYRLFRSCSLAHPIFFSNFPAKNLALGRMCRSRSPQISLR